MRSGRRSTTSSETSSGALLALAWTNVALHAAGLAMAWIGLRPGSTLIPLAERMAYLANDPPAWKWGWGLWMLCALALLANMAVLRRALSGDPLTARLALRFTTAGMLVDLSCDVLQMEMLPLTASLGSSIFLGYERLAFIGGLTVANGLYTVGLLLMNLCVRGIIGTPARIVGWAAVVSGFSLAAGGFVSSHILLQAATGATITFYCLWTVLVARDLR